MALIKKTIEITLESQPYLDALMTAMSWKETGRTATGGMMSKATLLMEYEGEDFDFREDGYLMISPNNAMFPKQPKFYSFMNLEGVHEESEEKFQQVLQNWLDDNQVGELVVKYLPERKG